MTGNTIKPDPDELKGSRIETIGNPFESFRQMFRAYRDVEKSLSKLANLPTQEVEKLATVSSSYLRTVTVEFYDRFSQSEEGSELAIPDLLAALVKFQDAIRAELYRRYYRESIESFVDEKNDQEQVVQRPDEYLEMIIMASVNRIAPTYEDIWDQLDRGPANVTPE